MYARPKLPPRHTPSLFLFLSLLLPLLVLSAPPATATTPAGPASATPPYAPGSISLTTPPGRPCTAVLTATPVGTEGNPACGRTTWPATTTSSIPVDCGGCHDVDAVIAMQGCPKGGKGHTVHEATTALTVWQFACAPSSNLARH